MRVGFKTTPGTDLIILVDRINVNSMCWNTYRFPDVFKGLRTVTGASGSCSCAGFRTENSEAFPTPQFLYSRLLESRNIEDIAEIADSMKTEQCI
jgi:hypothetical protein